MLTVERDILVDKTGCYATSTEPWLRFRSPEAFRPGALVELRYGASLFDDPVRPILRFWTRSGQYQDHLLPAPCKGEAIWVGRVPADRTAVWISPTDQTGRFDFEALSIEPASLRTMFRKAIRSPRRMFYGVAARLVGLTDEADLNLRWALGGEDLSEYKSWSAARTRRPVHSIIDKPRSDWTNGPTISLVVRTSDAAASGIDATCRSIAAQSYPNWRVLFADEPNDDLSAAHQGAWLQDSRFRRLSAPFPGFDIDTQDQIAVLNAGDEIASHALACFVEHFARNPHHSLVYADETRVDAQGRLTPQFKPKFSPILQRWAPYVGRAALFRSRVIASVRELTAQPPDELLDRLLAGVADLEVGHIGRVLFHFPQKRADKPAPRAASFRQAPAGRSAGPRATVIVPTRDRADLLEPCLETLLNDSSFPRMTVLVVDNGSVEPATHRLLQRLQARDSRLGVIQSPGPFNFSALCNEGALAASGDYLIFLNNDTAILTPDWIEQLLCFAEQPGVGAVGAKLLHPNRTVQHVGVVLGMGGVAGHFGADLPEDAPGWLGRSLVPHEVSAVTGACLMVERAKFDAVGGFDAANLPVELNDIDLCLRLAERGWKTICNAQVKLLHHQSASRGGATFRLQRVYGKERSYFLTRWKHKVRHDPYFHPGMSLYGRVPALA